MPEANSHALLHTIDGSSVAEEAAAEQAEVTEDEQAEIAAEAAIELPNEVDAHEADTPEENLTYQGHLEVQFGAKIGTSGVGKDVPELETIAQLPEDVLAQVKECGMLADGGLGANQFQQVMQEIADVALDPSGARGSQPAINDPLSLA